MTSRVNAKTSTSFNVIRRSKDQTEYSQFINELVKDSDNSYRGMQTRYTDGTARNTAEPKKTRSGSVANVNSNNGISNRTGLNSFRDLRSQTNASDKGAN